MRLSGFKIAVIAGLFLLAGIVFLPEVSATHSVCDVDCQGSPGSCSDVYWNHCADGEEMVTVDSSGDETSCSAEATSTCNSADSEVYCECRSLCGNGVVNIGEECDPGDPSDPMIPSAIYTSCTDLGYDGGDISCTSSCELDDSACYYNYDCIGDGVLANQCDSTLQNRGSCSASCGSPGSCSSISTSDNCNSPYFEESYTNSCAELNHCGNGVCDYGESPLTCSIDCSPTCGDGICEVGYEDDSDSFYCCAVDCGVTCSGPGPSPGPGITGDEGDSELEREYLSHACQGSASCSCVDQGLCEPCDPADGTYNCRNLDSSSDTAGSEDGDYGSGACSDGIDNDCDGAVDVDDWDCPVAQCSDASDETRYCSGFSGDLADVEQTDGYYCDTNPSPNRCCPTGEEWTGSSCEPRPAGCNPSPCNEEPMTAAWWSDSNCITASQGCCYDSIQHGEPYYQYEAPVAY